MIIQALREIAQQRAELDADAIRGLSALTESLLQIAEPDGSASEYARFLAVKGRRINLGPDLISQLLRGRRVLVTGGTGCIGSALLQEIQAHGPAAMVSISRRPASASRKVPRVAYCHLDVRDRPSLEQLMLDYRPHVVFHLAAQRDPGAAESAPAHTLSVNISGTVNVLRAAQLAGAEKLIHASTGKTMRLFTSDIYAASKKVGEAILAEAAQSSAVGIGSVRFTHVMDNSILLDRLNRWIGTGSPVRLHGPEANLYAQSAQESAQLLLNAGLAQTDGRFHVHAIRNLDWPFFVLDLATGLMREQRTVAPIHFCGYEPGYEVGVHPATYDPRISGDVSPLINAIEAPLVSPSETCADIDRFTLRADSNDAVLVQLKSLLQACESAEGDDLLRDLTADLMWAMLHARLNPLPKPLLASMLHRARTNGNAQAATQSAFPRITSAIERALARCDASQVPDSGDPGEPRLPVATVAD